ncbi:putative COP9 subunit 3 [Aspergillus ibericus CBS 121593]|uniref:COP9 signalosome complex subunit 3 n=1 Tax=Aspergillus ibericus CBS 121593 TaxID=1448316 RepID=A0A395HGF6_9EURO|nr:COP9 signalosome complex subunit 3 [Aspergillus ibericus CBS 121593]RAL06215.1 COP9 signalosome complex subunit 3 [Aspergillus ibericus CBS 121593]
MAEILLHLTTVSSQLQALDDTSDERYDTELRDLIAYIKQFNRNIDSQYLLDNLSPSQHTLSYLIILNLHIETLQNQTKNRVPDEIKPGNDLWAKAVYFLRSFDPIQVRYAGHEWRQLVELIGQSAEAVAKPFLAVQVIREALLRLDSSGVLTSVHITFLRLSLISRSYSHALPILEKEMFRFPTSSGQAYRKHIERPLCSEDTLGDTFISDASGFSAKLTYRDHTSFFLYGAMIYMALKYWDKALHLLTIVISSPVNDSVSKIMVESYKKWVLASLLGHGKLVAPPKIISPHVLKVYQTLSKPYASLADAFERSDFQRLRADIDFGRSVWRADNNEGLVCQLFRAYNTFLVLKLGRTFSALTTADVARRTFTSLASSANVEEFVASLVMSETLGATLVHLHPHGSATMLRFSAPTKLVFNKEISMRNRLIEGGRALRFIANDVDQCSSELKLGNENLQLLSRNQRWSDTSGKGGGDSVGEADGGLDIEEDIMGDAT